MSSHTLRNIAPDTREGSLPKWAQQILQGLRHNIDTLQRAVREIELTDETLVVTGRYGSIPKPVDVEKHENVTFFPRKFDGHDHYDVRLDGDDLVIYASDSIDLHQQSGNVVRIKLARGITEDVFAQNAEALAKGWSPEEVRKDMHLGHIPHRRDVYPRTQAEIEAGR